MATELTVQSERAYQKQPHIFLNSKSKGAKSRKVGKGGRRWYKDVGLGFRTPKTAIEGSYIGQCFHPHSIALDAAFRIKNIERLKCG
jgi:small subunit ribosomal protein S11e